MSHLVVCPLKLDARKFVRWAILILPVFLCGCFDTQLRPNQSIKAKESGISSISRFFTFSQDDSSAKTAESANNQAFPIYASDLANLQESAGSSMEDTVALPDYIAAGREGVTGASGSSRLSEVALGQSRSEQSSSFRSAVSLVFNAPFSRIFANVFEKGELPQSESAEEENPFTEALQKQKASTAEETADSKDTVAQEENQSAQKSTDSSDSNANAANEPPLLAGFSSGSFLILGDFDGSGLLQAKSAQRSGDRQFVSTDGARAFYLYINPDAVARQSSFYVDDIDMDGNADIVAAREEWLLGALLLGDGAGGYKTGGSFVTAYDAVIPCAGPVRNGMRQIMTVSPSFGLMRTYQYTDRYRLLQSEYLSFAPEYLLHLISSDSELDYVMAAQIGGAEQLLGWQADGLLAPASEKLGVDAAVLNGNLDSYSLRAYQVGNYASIMLASKGASFNVANMRLMPGTYLVIGDFKRKGTLDVAVAGLESFSPAQ